MQKEKINLHYKNGKVEGIYIHAGSGSPLIIFINGHNGFYNYGMFPYLQQKFYENGISSFSFNFSHGGVIGDADIFEDLKKYEQNCMRLETEDLLCVLHHVNKEFKDHLEIFLLAHSLGGVPTIFGANKAIEEKIKIDGIILVSSVKTLNFWPTDMLTEWAKAGVYYKKNNRTKQELPQGFEFLQEVLNSETEWNVKNRIHNLIIPILIIHGGNDEAVPVEHSKFIYAWIKSSNANAHLKIVPNATHTFNIEHPFKKTSNELEELIITAVDWIHANSICLSNYLIR